MICAVARPGNDHHDRRSGAFCIEPDVMVSGGNEPVFIDGLAQTGP